MRLAGQTMGTSYRVVAIDSPSPAEELQAAIERSLDEVNGRFSNWDPESEVSILNEADSLQAISVSQEFVRLMQIANRVHQRSLGYFDVTLGPLIDLWGFGPSTDSGELEMLVPDPHLILETMQHVGQDRLLVLDEESSTIQKLNSEVSINLSAIAKGHAVDRLGDVLAEFGVKNSMIEIGGDLAARGHNQHERPWQIAIERPDAAGASVQKIVPLSDLAMATSGDYRNYFEQDQVRYSHIIDPQTGHPITHRTASVTVLAETAARADAWATALLALGRDRGLPIAEQHKLAVFFIDRARSNENLEFEVTASSAFRAIDAQDS